MLVTRTKIAEILGVDLTTIDARVRKGMPVEFKGGKGTPSKYDTEAVIQWHIDQEVEATLSDLPTDDQAEENTAAELKRRKLQAETEIVEIDLAQKKAGVVVLEDAVAIINDAVATLRAKVLNLPRRVAPLIVGETNEDTIKDIVDREANDILQELHTEFARNADELRD